MKKAIREFARDPQLGGTRNPPAKAFLTHRM